MAETTWTHVRNRVKKRLEKAIENLPTSTKPATTQKAIDRNRDLLTIAELVVGAQSLPERFRDIKPGIGALDAMLELPGVRAYLVANQSKDREREAQPKAGGGIDPTHQSGFALLLQFLSEHPGASPWVMPNDATCRLLLTFADIDWNDEDATVLVRHPTPTLLRAIGRQPGINKGPRVVVVHNDPLSINTRSYRRDDIAAAMHNAVEHGAEMMRRRGLRVAMLDLSRTASADTVIYGMCSISHPGPVASSFIAMAREIVRPGGRAVGLVAMPTGVPVRNILTAPAAVMFTPATYDDSEAVLQLSHGEHSSLPFVRSIAGMESARLYAVTADRFAEGGAQ